MDSAPVVVWSFDSRLDAVDEAEDAVRQLAHDIGFTDSETYFVGLAAREILVNAIKHGNRFNRAKQVCFRLYRIDRGLAVEVSDEGDGFRIEDVEDPHLPENRERPSGRGVTMARTIMDELTVESCTPHGSLVRMVKRLPSTPHLSSV